jgi:hypothetical protein
MKSRTYITETKQSQLVDAYSQLLKKNNYVSTEKLSAVFKMWLKYYVIAVSNYDVYLENELNIFTKLSRLDSIHFRRVGDSVSKTDLKLKSLVKYLLAIVPIKYAVLPGGKTRLIDSFVSLITVQKTRRLKIKLNEELLGEFHQLSKSILSDDEYTDFVRALPRALFSTQINASFLPKIIKCSPICFFHEEHVKVLFVNKPTSIIGFQHGGNYGEFKINYFERFELKASSRYYYWGLGEINIHQNRYYPQNAVNRNILSFSRIDSIVPNIFLKTLIPIFSKFNQQSSSTLDELIKKSLLNKPYQLIRHPKSFDKNKSRIDSTAVESIMFNDITLQDKQHNLFILDRPGHTFMYQAIYQSLPFILYFNRDWNEYYTEKYRHFISLLEFLGILFYWDQEKEFIERILKYEQGEVYSKEIFNKIRNHLSLLKSN